MIDLIDELEKTLEPIEIIELLNNFTFDQEKLNEYAVKNMVCPKCCGELKWNSWTENRGECFGFPVVEEIGQLVCQSCEWVDE